MLLRGLAGLVPNTCLVVDDSPAPGLDHVQSNNLGEACCYVELGDLVVVACSCAELEAGLNQPHREHLVMPQHLVQLLSSRAMQPLHVVQYQSENQTCLILP